MGFSKQDSSSDLEVGVDALQIHESDDQLIIGLDFGTTFSKPEPTSILDWPGLEGFKQPKVPTILSYDPKHKNSFTWGAQKHKHAKIEGLKLLLDPGQETPLYIPETNTAAELKKLGKPATDVVTDYIASIYNHALSRIETKIPAEYLKMCQKKFVVTVPAVWSSKAMNATLAAAKQAGIHPVSLIKEPEAAALYTLHMLQDKALSIGDAFVLCDAGGGTVDLISYEITALAPRLELKELVTGKGGMAGSLGLNKRFAQAVKNIVGEDQYFHLRKETGFEQAMNQFDKNIKTAFRGDLDEDYYVNFPMANLIDDHAYRLMANCWNMKGDDVKKIFQPLITDIERMVEDQVNLVRVKRLNEGHPKANEIKAIFLVGGFGSSEYLKQCLQTSHPAIQVIQPNDAWSAIVKYCSTYLKKFSLLISFRGAVLSQLPQEAAITSTVATKHYGVSANAAYDRREDAGQEVIIDKYTGKKQVSKMTWYINRGEDMLRDQKMVFSFYRSLPEDHAPSRLIFTDDLLECSLDQAIKYPKKGITSTNCKLTADLSAVNRNHFHSKVAIDGTPYVDVDYDLVVSTKTAMMKFSLEVDGEEMGSIEANYE
ncbi:MAG: hypothetical protein Q9215_004678 [Flavoplaca cf. flavocitrina]